MKHTQKLMEIVKDLLYKSYWNRNSDYALYADYIAQMLPNEKPNKYYEIMSHYEEYDICSFKAVERARRKVQEWARINGVIGLLSDKQVEKWRNENEQKYIQEFAKGSEKNW